MARTYTDIPEPRKVLEADTIRGYSRETVEEALANADRTKITLSIPDADIPAILGGGDKTYYVSEDDFVKKDAVLNEFPQNIAIEVNAVDRVLYPSFNIKTSTSVFYSITFFFNSNTYYLYASITWSDVESKWRFHIYGVTL